MLLTGSVTLMVMVVRPEALPRGQTSIFFWPDTVRTTALRSGDWGDPMAGETLSIMTMQS